MEVNFEDVRYVETVEVPDKTKSITFIRGRVPVVEQPYSDKNTQAILMNDGSYFAMKESRWKIDFMDQFNTNEKVIASLDEDDHWNIRLYGDVYGESMEIPTGVYTNKVNGTTIRINKDGNNFRAYDFIDYNKLLSGTPGFFLPPADLKEHSQKWTITGSSGFTTLGSHAGNVTTTSLLLGPNSQVAYPLEFATLDTNQSFFAASQPKDKTLVYINRGDQMVFDSDFNKEFVFTLHGRNDGLILNSPIFQILKENEREHELAEFRLRAGAVYEPKRFVVNNAIPTGARQLIFSRSSSQKIEVHVDDGTLICTSACIVDTTTRFGMLGVVNQTIEIPKHRTVVAAGGEVNAIIVLAFQTADINQILYWSDLFKIELTSGDIFVNGIDSTLTTTTGPHLLLVSIEGGVLTVLHSGINSEGAVQAVSAYTGETDPTIGLPSHRQAFVSGGTLGAVVEFRNSSSSLASKAWAVVSSLHTTPLNRSFDMGTYTNGTFSSGFTYDEDSGLLTTGSDTWDRQRFELSEELRNIFGLSSRVVFGQTIGRKAYDRRVHSIVIRELACGRSAIGDKLEEIPVENRDDVVAIHKKKLECRSKIATFQIHMVDAQNGEERPFVKEGPAHLIFEVEPLA